MAHASLLNDNLAHKLVLALVHDNTIPSSQYTAVLGKIVDVLANVRAAHPEEVTPASASNALTAKDALAIAQGSMDSSGGYRDDPKAIFAFKQGIKAVCEAIERQMRDGNNSFSAARHAAESALMLYSNHSTSITQFGSGWSCSEKEDALAREDGAKTANLLLEAAEQHGLADGQVFAAHLIGTRRPLAASPQKEGISEARGEELMAHLEEGISSPAAEYLRARILAGDKQAALAALEEESMSGQNAEDLYAYCRQKWLGKRLALVEVPVELAEDIVRKNMPSTDEFDGFGPDYVVRQGNGVTTAYVTERAGRLWFSLGGLDRVEVKDVPQIWMVVELP